MGAHVSSRSSVEKKGEWRRHANEESESAKDGTESDPFHIPPPPPPCPSRRSTHTLSLSRDSTIESVNSNEWEVNECDPEEEDENDDLNLEWMEHVDEKRFIRSISTLENPMSDPDDIYR